MALKEADEFFEFSEYDIAQYLESQDEAEETDRPLSFDCFEIDERPSTDRKLFVLVIYDIVNNKRRTKFAKLMQGYGFRIQKSCFEAMIPKKTYRKMLSEIPVYLNEEEDTIRIYHLRGQGEIIKFGIDRSVEPEDVIII